MSWLSEYLKDQVRYQAMDLSGVKIQHKFHEKTAKFFIDSCAGLITYRAKGADDIARFRNKWVNRIELLRLLEVQGEDVNEKIFSLYEEILSSEKVSYEANANTRLKRRWNCIKSKFKIF